MIRALIELFFPPRCAYCRRKVGDLHAKTCVNLPGTTVERSQT